jgi:hypothetical protein
MKKYKNGSDISNKRGNWKNLKIIQEVPQNHLENT